MLKLAEHEFEAHWQAHGIEPLPASKRQEARGFLKPLFDHAASDSLVTVLDAGCGDGVHLAVLADAFGEQLDLTGLDLSRQAISAARQHVHSPWRPVQADVAAMPFDDGVFDAAFSFGVLAYTPDPRQSFAELCRVVRPGGLVGVWFYPRRRGPLGLAFTAVRRLCRLGGPFLTARIADLLVPLLPLLPTRSRITLANAGWRQCREVVLVNIAPPTLHFPDADEVERMFAEGGLAIVSRDEQNPITLWGRKPLR